MPVSRLKIMHNFCTSKMRTKVRGEEELAISPSEADSWLLLCESRPWTLLPASAGRLRSSLVTREISSEMSAVCVHQFQSTSRCSECTNLQMPVLKPI